MTTKYNNVFIEDAYTVCGNYEMMDHYQNILIRNIRKTYTSVKNLGRRLKFIF